MSSGVRFTFLSMTLAAVVLTGFATLVHADDYIDDKEFPGGVQFAHLLCEVMTTDWPSHQLVSKKDNRHEADERKAFSERCLHAALNPSIRSNAEKTRYDIAIGLCGEFSLQLKIQSNQGAQVAFDCWVRAEQQLHLLGPMWEGTPWLPRSRVGATVDETIVTRQQFEQFRLMAIDQHQTCPADPKICAVQQVVGFSPAQ